MNRVLVIAFVALVALPVAAQQPDPIAVVAHVLELSEDQIIAWGEILQARQAAIQPLAQEAHAREELIGQSFGSGSPDPTTIGRALIELRTLQGQINAANVQAAAQFEQLLGSEQRERLNAIRSGAQVCPTIPAFQATGLLSAP